MKDCIAFQRYTDNFRFHLQSEIELNGKRMRNKLGDKIIDTMTKTPKEQIIKDLAKLEQYGYDAYEVLYHILPPNQEFYALFEELFQLSFLADLLEKQTQKFHKFELEVNMDELLTLNVENEIDFSVFQPFNYITENIWMTDPLLGYHGDVSQNVDVDYVMKTLQPYKQPVTLFKTRNQGWGVKAMTRIPSGKVFPLFKER